MTAASTIYALLDAARQALEAKDGESAQRLAGIVLAREPEHLEARHLSALAIYRLAFGDRPELDSNSDDNRLGLHARAGNWHLALAITFEKGGQAELARLAYRTAALLDFHLLPEQRVGFGGPFNGQVLRTGAFRAIAASRRLAEVIETGTHRGTTSEFMARHVACPVKTTEHNPYYFESSQLRFTELKAFGGAWAGNLQLFPLESRHFLAEMLRQPAPEDDFSFFYLDAHGDYLEGRDIENPLVGEVGLIRPARRHCIIMIDDFAVPDDPAYIACYGSSIVDLAPLVPSFDAWFFPQAAHHDTGALRGCVVLSGSRETTTLLGEVAELRFGGRA